MTANQKPDLRVQFCGIELRNPVIAASGTFGYGVEFEDIVSLKTIGAFVTKGLSREPMAGNPPPRSKSYQQFRNFPALQSPTCSVDVSTITVK